MFKIKEQIFTLLSKGKGFILGLSDVVTYKDSLRRKDICKLVLGLSSLWPLKSSHTRSVQIKDVEMAPSTHL